MLCLRKFVLLKKKDHHPHHTPKYLVISEFQDNLLISLGKDVTRLISIVFAVLSLPLKVHIVATSKIESHKVAKLCSMSETMIWH